MKKVQVQRPFCMMFAWSPHFLQWFSPLTAQKWRTELYRISITKGDTGDIEANPGPNHSKTRNLSDSCHLLSTPHLGCTHTRATVLFQYYYSNKYSNILKYPSISKNAGFTTQDLSSTLCAAHCSLVH